jgi:epoxyqueuosine reductase
MDAFKKEMIEYGLKLGFSEIRFTSAEAFEDWEAALQKRLQIQEDREQWMVRRARMEADPKQVMEDAMSIVVAILSYCPDAGEGDQDRGQYSPYYRASHQGYGLIQKLGDFIQEGGYQAIANPPLPVKAIARRAGVGYFGKNSLIHHPEYGSFISIHVLVSNAPIPPDPPFESLTDCGSCTLCMAACPTGAIQEDGTVLLSRCLRSFMESSGVIPEDIREKMGTRILGCDACQIGCPRNRNISAGLKEIQEDEDGELFSIWGLLTENGQERKKRMARIAEKVGKNYARPRRLLSLAAIAAGNTGDPRYIPALKASLRHPYPPVRIHSAWSLGRIGGEESMQILQEALEDEEDRDVLEAIRRALRQLASLPGSPISSCSEEGTDRPG